MGAIIGPGKEKEAAEEDRKAPYMDRMIDIILSVLAVPAGTLPTAPLRDSVEALFRAFAAQLTQTGVLILACLKQPYYLSYDRDKHVFIKSGIL